MNEHNELWDAIKTAERRPRWLRDDLVAQLSDQIRVLQAQVAELRSAIDSQHTGGHPSNAN